MKTSSASSLPGRSSSNVTILSRALLAAPTGPMPGPAPPPAPPGPAPLGSVGGRSGARLRSPNAASSYSSPAAPLRLNSLRLRGTKYSTHLSAWPADRRAGVFLWKLSSP
ncbi:unnamed protein product [Chrysodeixis includens]|uniref:Uncharacterized protein n=1 Tax=Chrysodeixis includens TaxID=689277 RepID=A0A9N8KVQ2_CHRIL|nr:unnamed protein product [Chrysodeixis includens]